MAKKVIFEAKANDLTPLVHNNAPIYQRYRQILSVLQPLGEQYTELLAEPQMIAGKYYWKTSYINDPQPLTQLDEAGRQAIHTKLNTMLGKVNNICANLRDNGQNEYATFIEQAVSLPGYECVLVEGDRIVLAAWGFALSDPTGASHQPPVNILREKLPVAPIPVPVDDPGKISKPVEQASATTSAAEAPKISTPVPPVTPPPVQNSGFPEGGRHTPPPPPVINGRPRKGMPGWLWFLLGALLMLLIFLLLRGCDGCNRDNGNHTADGNERHNPPHRPDNPYHDDGPGDPFFDTIRQVPPIDTTKIIHDPDQPGDRQILSNSVNVALDKGLDVKDFILKMQQEHPDSLSVSFADTTIKLIQFMVPDGEYQGWIQKFKEMPEVKLAFPTTLFQNGTLPQDPGFRNPKQSWYFDDIQALDAWDITQGDTSVIVAIADNCFDLTHPELASKVVMPYNVNTGNSDIHLVRDEGNMHGTHVAGTATGLSNNGGVCGIAPGCKFMPIQVADDNGNMSNISILAAALYAIHHGAAVVNFSLGAYFGPLSASDQQELITGYGIEECEFWNEVYDFANEENCVFVLAAGNENILAGCDPFARSNKVLVVSAYQDNARSPKAEFSNFGQYSNISAPGVEIYSSVPGGGYDFLQGTSMAAPIVTGAVALVKSKYPNLTAPEIVSVLKSTAKPLGTRPEIGPLIQIADALRMAADGVYMEIPENPTSLSFAVGRWKSTTDLVDVNTGKVVELIFDIKANATGTVEYHEQGGQVFKAPLKFSRRADKILVKQETDATTNGQDGYSKCEFEVERKANGKAFCHTIYDDDSQGADFYLEKVR